MVLDPGSMSGNDCYLILKPINKLLKISPFWRIKVKSSENAEVGEKGMKRLLILLLIIIIMVL